MWAPTFIWFLIVFSSVGLLVDAMPVKQWPVVPNRQLHWTGFLYKTNPAYATNKPPTSIDTEYQSFLKAKASGQNPTATFRPDSWSKYNYHIETRGLQSREESQAPTRTDSASETATTTSTTGSCSPSTSGSEVVYVWVGKESKQTCYPRPSGLKGRRRDLFIGSTVAFLAAILILVIYYTQYKFFKYFDYKERWHVEKARYRSIKRVNQTLLKTGGEPFPQNIDHDLINTRPSKFWARIFESERFIGGLLIFERVTKAEGKFTGIMKRPKLGDESSGIPLNSPRARRKYGSAGPSGPAVPKSFVACQTRNVSGSELPTPVGSLHRRGRASRAASIMSQRAQSNKDPIDTSTIAIGDTYHASSSASYQMPSGFGESPWGSENGGASDGDH
ncbi:hypothetical protein ABW21_db0209245 [Orbilia brochopaga]|nr:hypothetical protein ABW21_db0209245 [Drechslerella brochopaga]